MKFKGRVSSQVRGRAESRELHDEFAYMQRRQMMLASLTEHQQKQIHAAEPHEQDRLIERFYNR
jgi:hypothetical protein